ncbi:uncharacterized protein MONBRDRAFT_39162, partial [Monosiga brevicollis MX1]
MTLVSIDDDRRGSQSTTLLFLACKRDKQTVFLEPSETDKIQRSIDVIADLLQKDSDHVSLVYQGQRLDADHNAAVGSGTLAKLIVTFTVTSRGDWNAVTVSRVCVTAPALTEEALKKLGERADAVNEQRERSRRKRMRKRAKAEAEFRDDGKSHLKELVGEGLLGPDPEEEAPSTPVTGGANPSSTPNNDKSDGQNATSSPSKRAKSITGLAGGPVSSKHLQAIKLATNIDRRE